MGRPMAENLAKAGFPLLCTDVDRDRTESLAAAHPNVALASSLEEISKETDTIISVLPNDAVLKHVSSTLIETMGAGGLHISCSTVAPTTSRELSQGFEKNGITLVAAPIFARPDGMAAMQANFVMSGPAAGLAKTGNILQHTAAGLYAFGEDTGAANVVKLCGNFLIGCLVTRLSL